jgi:hypothetical protein
MGSPMADKKCRANTGSVRRCTIPSSDHAASGAVSPGSGTILAFLAAAEVKSPPYSPIRRGCASKKLPASVSKALKRGVEHKSLESNRLTPIRVTYGEPSSFRHCRIGPGRGWLLWRDTYGLASYSRCGTAGDTYEEGISSRTIRPSAGPILTVQ